MADTPRRQQAERSVEANLNRANELMAEVRDYFHQGIDPSEETAAEQIALTQVVTAAAMAHLRMAEVEMAFSTWQERS